MGGGSAPCIGVTRLGSPCKRKTACRWHTPDTCAICLEDIQFKDIHVTTCKHHYHRECIRTWYISSDECPVCRLEQSTDPLIIFKRSIRDSVSAVYIDAIRTVEEENTRLRRRRARQNNM